MKINVERDYDNSVINLSIRFFDGHNLGPDISAELSGCCEMILPQSDAWDEIHYWRDEVNRANAEQMTDILEPLSRSVGRRLRVCF